MTAGASQLRNFCPTIVLFLPVLSLYFPIGNLRRPFVCLLNHTKPSFLSTPVGVQHKQPASVPILQSCREIRGTSSVVTELLHKIYYFVVRYAEQAMQCRVIVLDTTGTTYAFYA